MFFRPKSGLYYIKESDIKLPNSNVTSYYLQYYKSRFDTPNKLYGDILKNVIRVWNEYVTSGKTTAALFTGLPGTGKTLSAELISNLAIDNDMGVVMCIEIKYTVDLIRFLAQLNNCVVFIDEFAKVVDNNITNYMLSMLSDINNTNKLILLTENDPRMINQFILNRPGRVRYHFDSNRLSKAVFEDYCKNFDIKPEFYKELELKYRKAKEFSFDQLEVIVDEHLKYPNEDLDCLLNILNLSALNKTKKFELVAIKTEDDVDINKLGIGYRFHIIGDYDGFKKGYDYARIEVFRRNDDETVFHRGIESYRLNYENLDYDADNTYYTYEFQLDLNEEKKLNCKAIITYE